MATVATEERAPATSGLRLRWRVLISVLVVLHLAAVFTPPFRFASRSAQGEASPVADAAYRAFQPYINAAYLDHGYFYFAPNPGPSHLVRYEVDMGEAREPLVGVFPHIEPDRPRIIGTQQPRVIYHRHFMLAESLHANFTPPAPPDDLPESAELRQAILADWTRRRETYEVLKTSFEQHLSAIHGGRPVRIVRLEHRQPTPQEFLGGMAIDDPRTYRDLPEVLSPGEMP
ncbi:MAG: hypothetical protein KY475_01390 [Planctomycetes bacterium]|nr:hypothetical protein [Planctomycetota bacterium]